MPLACCRTPLRSRALPLFLPGELGKGAWRAANHRKPVQSLPFLSFGEPTPVPPHGLFLHHLLFRLNTQHPQPSTTSASTITTAPRPDCSHRPRWHRHPPAAAISPFRTNETSPSSHRQSLLAIRHSLSARRVVRPSRFRTFPTRPPARDSLQTNAAARSNTSTVDVIP